MTGLQPGAGSTSPIALSPDIDLLPKMAETLLPSDVVGLARVMPRGDVSFVAARYGAGNARVAEVLVDVGDTVAKGAPLARLDNRSALERAVLAVKEAALMQTRAAVKPSREEARATRDQTISAAAEARLTRFSILALENQPDVLVAARNRDAATDDLARERLDLERSFVLAPIAGTILDIHATPGLRPPAGGIMDMGDTSRMMAEVEAWQDRITSVAPGRPVELAAMALGQTLHGKVDRIGRTVDRQGMISDDTAENEDARAIRVLVALDHASSAIAARFTNLEVIARIDTSAPRRAAPRAACCKRSSGVCRSAGCN